MTELPSPPSGTTLAWVDEIAGTIIAAALSPIEVADLYALPPGATRHAIPPEQHAAIVASSRSWCVVEGEVVPRSASAIALSPTTIDADGEDEAVISGIPDGTKMRLMGAVSVPWTTVTGGSVTITCSEPGKIRVEAQCPAPYADWAGVIDAV